MNRVTPLLCMLLAAVGAAADSRPLAPADLWAVKRVGAPEVAPDGRHAVFPLTAYDTENGGGTTNLMLVNLRDDSLRQFTRHDGVDADPVWSPDGSHIAFTSRRDGRQAQLFVMPVDGGEARQLTALPVPVSSPRWFPDGSRIAVWARVPADFDGDFDARRDRNVFARVTEDRIYRFWDRWLTDGLVHRLLAIDVATGEAVDLMPGSGSLRAAQGQPKYDISPDGNEIAIAMNASPPPYEYINNDVFLLTPDGSGEMVNITADNPANDINPVYGPGGRYIYYGRQSRIDFYADTVRLVRYDRNRDSHRVLTADVDLSFQDWVVSEDERMIFARAQDRAAVSLFSIPAIGGRATEVHRGGTVGGFALGPRNALVFTQASLTQPPELYRVRRRGGRADQLTDINGGLLTGIEFGRVENITYPGADGAAIQAWVVYPPGFDDTRQWPLLTLLHGGPHSIFPDDFSFRWNLQALAAPGYVLIAPNFHGSSSFGQEFALSIHGNHAELPFRDVMKAVDMMAARDYIDGTRLAAAGGSYGGYLVSWIAGHTDRFGALINHAGVYNLMNQFASDSTLHREGAYDGTPWDGIERLNRFNPAMFAENFTTPMLVIHGELDYRVPVGQGLEVYGVYKGKGLDARLVYYPDENHWILKPHNSLHWHAEFHGWLERWIGVGPTEATPTAP